MYCIFIYIQDQEHTMRAIGSPRTDYGVPMLIHTMFLEVIYNFLTVIYKGASCT